MKTVWITKHRAFGSEGKATRYMDDLHKQITEYRKNRGLKIGPVRHGPDTILFVAGCTSYAIKRVIIE